MKNKTLVLGASLKADRYSNLAIHRLNDQHIIVKAIGLRPGKVDGISVETGMPNFSKIDTVTLYLNAKRQEEYYNYIISLKPRRVIFNPGTENEALMKLLAKNNILFEIACTLTLLATDQY